MSGHQPLPFPDAAIYQGGFRRVNVLVRESTLQERTALHSSTGAVYELCRKLKTANYGCVCLGIQLNHISMRTSSSPLMYSRASPGCDPKKVAIKVVEKRLCAESRSQEDPLKEMAVGQFLEDSPHPNLMGQLECISDTTHYYIVMEFSGGGELYDWVDRAHHFSETQARHFFSQIVAGLDHLHSTGVCHRDMSLENALVADDGHTCHIIDFGMSLRFSRNEHGDPLPFAPQGACGKKYYMAPEVLANAEPFVGPLADVWALGVMLFIMLVGAPPVGSACPSDARFCCLAGGQMRAMVASWGVTYVSDPALDLLEGILRVDPAERLSLTDISAHSWMQEMTSSQR